MALTDGDDQARQHLPHAHCGLQKALDLWRLANADVEANDALEFKLAAFV